MAITCTQKQIKLVWHNENRSHSEANLPVSLPSIKHGEDAKNFYSHDAASTPLFDANVEYICVKGQENKDETC